MTASIVVNGEARPLTVGTVVDLLRDEALDPARKGIAVARNGAVVPRRDWPATRLNPGDQIDIVKPFTGG